MADTKVIVGSTLRQAGDRFIAAWEKAERGEATETQRIVSFEDFATFMRVMTPERHRLLLHLRAHPERSVLALSKALGRGYAKVHGDVKALEDAGLVERAEGAVRATADKVLVEV